jgi:hypothetical protein
MLREARQVRGVAAHLRGVLGQIDGGQVDATQTVRARIEDAAVALEAIHNEPAPVDLDRLADPLVAGAR